MVPFLSAKSRIAWYNFLMIRFLNAHNRLYINCELAVVTGMFYMRLFAAASALKM